MSQSRLHGAAAQTLADYLMKHPYLPDWDERHERIAEWHIDQGGHRVCGCSIHQAFCWDCDIDRIIAYEQEQTKMRARGEL